MLDVALELAAAGHAIFPCSAEDKRPLPQGSWREHATTDAASIRIWWNEWPNALPAIALPANVVVVDIDPRNGGFESCKDLDLPDTRSVKTAGGGAHLYYSLPDGREVKNGPLYHAPEYQDRKGIDLKTAGGYVIAPGVARADGKRYELARDLPLTPAPEWILAARGRDVRSPSAPAVSAPVIWAATADTQDAMTPGLVAMLAPRLVLQGKRHEVARAVGGALAASGWTDEAIAELVRQLPSTDAGARVRDALQAAARFRSGEATPGFGALERAGYAPGLVTAMRVMSGGGLAEELAASADQRAAADIASKLTSDSDAFGKIIRIADTRAPIPPTNFLCEALNIAPGAPTLIAGYGGLGKSMLVQALVVCAATGRPLFQSMPVRRSRVLHFDYEQGEELTTARYKRIAADLGLDSDALFKTLGILSPPAVNLVTPGIEEGLSVMCQNLDLVVIDSLRAAVPGLEENDSKIREPLDMLFRVSSRTGCTFIVIHHARKPDNDKTRGGSNLEMRGSSAINDAARTVIMLEGAPMKDGKPAFPGFTVSPGKVRDGRKFQAFGVSIEDVPVEGVPFGDGLRLTVIDADRRTADANTAADNDDNATVLAFIAGAPAGVFRGGTTALCDLMDLPRERIRRAVARLINTGTIRKDAEHALIITRNP